MAEQHYAIVASHTLPITKHTHRLIAISIIKRTAKVVVDTFEALINPRCIIPKDISQEVNIGQADVRFEPVFAEIAENLLEILDGTILVSHRADFDYRVLRGEFKTIGYKFTSAIICTSKLAEKALPDLNEFHLKAVRNRLTTTTASLSSVKDQVLATEKIIKILRFEKSSEDNPEIQVRSSDSLQNKPELLNVHTLERKPGVYYFKDKCGNILYIGKAVRLRDRVRSHFTNKAGREKELCFDTSIIDHVYTGSNLIAELLEADEIFRHKPKFNISQKKKTTPYLIVTSETKKGYLRFSIIRKDWSDSVNEVYYNRKSVADKLTETCALFNLCPKYCGFHRILGKCSLDNFSECAGACIGEEVTETYNRRAKQAEQYLNNGFKNFAIKVKGRKPNETGFVLVRDGIYLGFGFVELSDLISSANDFESYLTPKTHSYHTTRIIDSFIRKARNKHRIIYLDVVRE